MGIVQTKRHRRMLIQMGHDQKKIFSWGSARFDPKWAKLNRSIQEKFNPKLKKNIIKVVFFLPHWSYNVDIPETIRSLKEIVADKSLFIVVKGHTRGSGSLNDRQIDELKNN